MNPGVLLFWFFIFLTLGITIGAWVQHRLDKRARAPERPAPIASAGNDLAREGDSEVLGAWRTANGKVWLQMDGSRLEDKSALKPDQQRRLLNLVLDLRPWLEKAPAAEVSSPAAAAAPVPAPAPAPQPEGKKGTQKNAMPATPTNLKSIVEQINDVLQVKLAGSSYQGRGIQLTEGLGGAVFVIDGVNKYEGIEAVPDPEIKALIRQALSEWENSTK